MKIALIGATGFVGTALLNEASSRGHEITAIARDISAISNRQATVKRIQGDVFNVTGMAAILKGNDVVISAYNAGWTNPNIYNDFLKGAQSIQEATIVSGVKRLIFIGGGGSLFIAPGVQVVDTPGFPAEWKPGALAARDYLNILKKETVLDWTFLSPALEMHQGTSGVKKGTYRTGLDTPVFDADNRSVLSVEDLALAVLDETENPKHSRQRFTVAY